MKKDIKKEIKDMEKRIEEIEKDKDIVFSKRFQNNVFEKLKKEGILVSKKEAEKKVNDFAKDLLTERIELVRHELRKLKREKQIDVSNILEKHRERIQKLEKERLRCPICLRLFEKPKSFTNHIREYRNKLEELKELKEEK